MASVARVERERRVAKARLIWSVRCFVGVSIVKCWQWHAGYLPGQWIPTAWCYLYRQPNGESSEQLSWKVPLRGIYTSPYTLTMDTDKLLSICVTALFLGPALSSEVGFRLN